MTANATLPVLFGTGIHADRPAAADVGSGGLYSCTTDSLIYQTDGSSWTTWAALGTGGTPVGTELSYVQFTSPVTINTTTEGTAVTVVTSAAVSYSGSQRIRIEFYAPYASIASTENLLCVIYDGASSIGRLWQGSVAAVGADVIAPSGSRFLTPSNASHTYSIRAYTQTTTGTIGAGAGGNGNYMPGFIRITTA